MLLLRRCKPCASICTLKARQLCPSPPSSTPAASGAADGASDHCSHHPQLVLDEAVQAQLLRWDVWIKCQVRRLVAWPASRERERCATSFPAGPHLSAALRFRLTVFPDRALTVSSRQGAQGGPPSGPARLPADELATRRLDRRPQVCTEAAERGASAPRHGGPELWRQQLGLSTRARLGCLQHRAPAAGRPE